MTNTQKKKQKYGPPKRKDKKNSAESSGKLKGFNPNLNKKVDRDLVKMKGPKGVKSRPGKSQRRQGKK